MQPHMEKLIKKHLGEQELSPEILNLLTDLEQENSASQDIEPDLMYMTGLNAIRDHSDRQEQAYRPCQ